MIFVTNYSLMAIFNSLIMGRDDIIIPCIIFTSASLADAYRSFSKQHQTRQQMSLNLVGIQVNRKSEFFDLSQLLPPGEPPRLPVVCIVAQLYFGPNKFDLPVERTIDKQ